MVTCTACGHVILLNEGHARSRSAFGAPATLRMICQGKGEPIGLIAVQGLERLERAKAYYLSCVGRLFPSVPALLMALSYLASVERWDLRAFWGHFVAIYLLPVL
jgi:hypothetical protein